MSYDPDLRRDTRLAEKLKKQIARHGPCSLRDFMYLCLQDPEHGYYRTQTAIGAGGDFITAPEISQIFGECIGLWCGVIWQQMGSPEQLNLVELGPGRATLIMDALRAIDILPDFAGAIHVHLVESSTPLRARQRKILIDVDQPVSWHDGIASVPAGPAIVIANEFLDALPIEQFVKCEQGWLRRCVTLDGAGHLGFADLPVEGKDLPASRLEPDAPAGTVREISDSHQLLHALVRHADTHPFAALILDYGYTSPQGGDTLQAVRHHKYEHPLTSPGEADLTAHVNFHALAQQIKAVARDSAVPVAVDGPVTQGEFLGRLGIVERAAKLISANPAEAGDIESAVARLLAPRGLGGRVKAMAVRSNNLPPAPGFSGQPRW